MIYYVEGTVPTVICQHVFISKGEGYKKITARIRIRWDPLLISLSHPDPYLPIRKKHCPPASIYEKWKLTRRD
jgi:hypothetical protein